MKLCAEKILRVVLMVVLSASVNGHSQTSHWKLPKTELTNTIPTNVFPTDEGMLIRFKKGGEGVIDVKKIKEAEGMKECGPADRDPEGHWGMATNGFQLSLQFDKVSYAVGERVEATTLVRNLTEKPQTFYFPLRIIAMKGNKELKRKNDTGLINITVPPRRTVYPHTQQKNKFNLNDEYDLSAGEYQLQAICKNPLLMSQPVSISITNAP